MALDLGENFNIDQEKELNGAWEDLGDGAWVLVARANNDNFDAEFGKLPTEIRKKFSRNQKGFQKRRDEIICDLMAKTILLDWRGLADGGEEVPYSKENAKEMLLKYPEFRDFIFRLSNDETRFLADE